MSDGERRLAAIMFTDMVGYTALGQRNESLSLALVHGQRKLLRPVFSNHNGREVKTIGDAFLVEFASALDAVRCAYDIQRATREFNVSLPEDRRVHLRVGIHLGDVVESEGDISGDAVNVASRIEAFAEDGGVCLTRQVYEQVQNKFELPLKSLGQKTLKNVASPVEVYKMVMPWSEEKAISSANPDRNRIAVLPFANMSPDPSDEYFADGMTEELISTTSSIAGLTLIARTSVMGYKGTNKKVEEIGKELSVGTVLEGSVRKAGNRLRITVQLIDVQSQGHLWVQSYDRSLDDIFAVQTDIAKQVADALRVRIRPSETRQIEKRPTNSTEAYVLYLKGRYYWNKRSQDGLNQAIKNLELAIKEDPNYALAYAGLADCYLILADYGFAPPNIALPKAKELATCALELDDGVAEIHVSFAYALARNDWNWARAEAEFKRAIGLNPGHAIAHHWYAALLVLLDRLDEAISEIDRAKELDPFSSIINVNAGSVYYIAGRYDQAMEQFRRVLDIDPDFALGHASLGLSCLQESMFDEAIAESQRAVELSGGSAFTKADLAYAYGICGKKEEAKKILDELTARSKIEYVPPFALAIIYAAIGEREKFFGLLEKAYEEFNMTPMSISHLPWLQDLRQDSRYLALLKKMGLPR